MPIDPMQAKNIFLAVLDLPVAERALHLDCACGGDADLRQRVEAMLRAHDTSGELMPRPALEMLAQDSTQPEATAAFDTPPKDATQMLGDGPCESLSYLAPSSKPGHLGKLGQYEIGGMLGKGGFGTVFKAFDDKLHRVVAIKVLAPELAANGTARKRFIREAQAAAAVKNDHVVAIYNVADEANPPYLVMEMIDGISLEDRLKKEGPLELKEILRIGMQMAEGLAAAHKQGLIHRDIKPGNILLENGVQRVKITDFGLARAADDASVTQSGVIAGTPMFMSPEQAEGLPLDARSDLFSLGSVLYVMCTGRAPFRASSTMAVLKRVCDEMPTPIREINPDVPDWLCAIVEKLQAKKVEDRFGSAREVAEVLGKHLADVQAHGRAEPRKGPGEVPAAPPKTWPLTRLGSPKIFAAALLAIAAIVLAVIYWPRNAGEIVPPENKLVANKTPEEKKIPPEKKPEEKKIPPEKKPEEKKTPPAPRDEWVQLFNGKDLTGWKFFVSPPPFNKGEKWTTNDGVLICKGRFNMLVTDRTDFENFHLRALVKPKTNSELYFRLRSRKSTVTPDPYFSWHAGDCYRSSFGSFVPKSPIEKFHVGEWGVTQNSKSKSLANRSYFEATDDWRLLEYIVVGDRLRVIVDGSPLREIVADVHLAGGAIALSQEGGGGPLEHEVHIKKIEIKELPPTPVETQPFVVLAKDQRPETRHATLAAAVAAAQSGDTIEIQGNGPFVTEPISVRRPLTIRAAAGFRPHLSLAPDAGDKDFFHSWRAALVLEGLTLEATGLPSTARVVRSELASLYLANCRLLTTEGTGAVVFDSNACIQNCEVRSGVAGLSFVRPSNGGSLVDNSLIIANHQAIWVTQKVGDKKESVPLVLRNNTMMARKNLWSYKSHLPKEEIPSEPIQKKPGLRLQVSGNVLAGGEAFFFYFPFDESEPLEKALFLLPEMVAVQDSNNLYSFKESFLGVYRSEKTKPIFRFKIAAEWHQFWRITESASQVGQPAFLGGDVLAKALVAQAKLTPADFRLAKGSPGQGVLPGGKDLGADVDLVGPGEAYERWKKTPAYQEWRKQTDELMNAK